MWNWIKVSSYLFLNSYEGHSVGNGVFKLNNCDLTLFRVSKDRDFDPRVL